MIDTSEFIPLGVFKKPISRMWEISGEKLIAIEDRLALSEDEASGVHQKWALHFPRMDGLDTWLPGRLNASAG